MKCILTLLFAEAATPAQTGTASITGTVLDAKTLKPVPAALVMAVQSGAPAFSKSTKTDANGAFQIQALPAGKYPVCVQAGDGYVDACQWGRATTVTLETGQAAGASIRLTAASILTIQVQDAQKAPNQKTKDGRRPELTTGVWGPKGPHYPARAVGGQAATVGSLAPVNGYSYQLGVPSDTALRVHISSRDLKLGDAVGAALPGNASQQAFQHVTGDASPKRFTFSVLGLMP